MLIRQLEYLVALASEQHFARGGQPLRRVAADVECRAPATSRTTSARQSSSAATRFRGSPPDGEIALHWARRMLSDEAALKQELDASRGTLKGRARARAIPSDERDRAVPLRRPSHARHPGVSIDESETNSIEMLRNLSIFELDAGITYIDNEPLDHVRALPIYDERYVAVIPESSELASRATVTWEQIATCRSASCTATCRTGASTTPPSLRSGAFPTCGSRSTR